jgi:1-acyl-sn-glycerol-3-phosphate acyltransferase
VGLPPFHWWRTVFFLIPAIGVYTAVLGTLSLASSLFDERGHFAHGCARAWSWLILTTTGVSVDLRGLDQLVRGKTYIFVANHQSIYDIPVVFASLPYQLRIIAKESLGRFPFLGWHLRRTGHLLVDRKNPDRAGILKRWRALVGQGLSLIISIDGTRYVMRKGRLMTCPGHATLVVHPPIETSGLEVGDARELAGRVRAIVSGATTVDAVST